MLYKIRHLTKQYGDRTVLDIQHLILERGKVYTLTGPNGAGKTTLLKILALLDKPTSGTMVFDGNEVTFKDNSLIQQRKSVVLLDQNPIMFTGSVEYNVGYGLKIRKVDRKEQARQVAEMLDVVGLKKFASHDAQSLSGGETKRVALARALAVQPKVLICDEPGANVDKENQEIILNILSKVNKERGTTIIFSTHYLSQGHRLADESLLLQNGVLSDILNENIYRAQIIKRENSRVLCRLAGDIEFSVPAGQAKDDDEIKIWLDPSKLQCAPFEPERDGSKQDQNSLVGHIYEIGRHNSKIRLSIDVGIILVIHIEHEHYRKHQLLIGDAVNVIIPDPSISCTLL